MAKKGDIAKENFKQILIDTFKERYIGTPDGKKFYIKVNDGAEDVQLAVSVTMPKSDFSVVSSDDEVVDEVVYATDTVSKEDQDILESLKRKLGALD